MNELLSPLQWPAMVITLTAAWLVTSGQKRRRRLGFWCFIVSNIVWIIWGWSANAFALIVLQVGLFIINVRGAEKNQGETDDHE
jgi:hypothetical protein